MGGSKPGNQAADDLRVQGEALQSVTTPFLQELYKQGLQMLQTGGVGAQLPIVNNAIEQSKQATSAATTQAKADMARSKTGNSTQGQSLLAGLNLSGNQATANIPTNFMIQFLQSILGVGAQNTATSSSAGAAASQNTQNAQASQGSGFLEALAAKFGQSLGAAGGSALTSGISSIGGGKGGTTSNYGTLPWSGAALDLLA